MSSRMFSINKIEIGYMIYYTAIDLFRNIEIKTTVAGFHMENRDMKTLGHIGRETGIGITKDKKSIGFLLA